MGDVLASVSSDGHIDAGAKIDGSRLFVASRDEPVFTVEPDGRVRYLFDPEVSARFENDNALVLERHGHRVTFSIDDAGALALIDSKRTLVFANVEGMTPKARRAALLPSYLRTRFNWE